MVDEAVKQAERLGLEHYTVEYVGVDSVFPNAYNPNRQSEHEFELLLLSIKEDGFTQPIVVLPSGEIVDGEHRWRAARKLGHEQIPVVVVDMTLTEMRLATIRHNVARGTHDLAREAGVLRDLQRLGVLAMARDGLLMSDRDVNRLLEGAGASEVYGGGEVFTEAWEPIRVTEDVVACFGEEGARRVVSQAVDERLQTGEKVEGLLTRVLIFKDEEAALVQEVLGESPVERLKQLCEERMVCQDMEMP